MLDFPAVLIRTSTERSEVLDKGTVVIGGIREQDIVQALDLAVAMHAANLSKAMPPDYLDGNVSAKVIRIIQSYTDIIRRTVWLQE